MELGLKGKVALVTGAGSQKGFGKAISLALANEGCDVIVCDLDLEGAKKTAAEIQALGVKSMAVKMDVTNAAEVKSSVAQALEQFKAIDILVNNAGGLFSVNYFVDKPEQEWNLDIDLNLKGTCNCTYAVLPQMLERKSGKIINISSISGTLTIPGTNTYSAAKAGVIGFTKNLGVEVAQSGINVNGVAPGMALTNFGGGAPPPEMLEQLKSTIPTRRINTAEDVANAVVFLASDAASNIVGQNLGVDGGQSVQ